MELLGLSNDCSRVISVELSLGTPHCNFWRKWKRIVTTLYPKCNNFWTRNVTRLAQNGTIFLKGNITISNATALKLLGQIPFSQKRCNAVLRWKPSRESSLLLLQSSQKAKLIKLLNNNFFWKDGKGVELDNYLLTRASGEAWNWSALFWWNSTPTRGNLFSQWFPLTQVV